jgi:micrococcal nuclease
MPVLATLLCLVVGVADGDTLTVRCTAADGDVTLQVRLAEIDAPEKGQAFGRRSKDHLATLCFGRSAVVKPTTTDRYGRTVARVDCEGHDANAALVQAGLAWAYMRYLTDPHIAELEREAREQRVGLWQDESALPPWQWRRKR